jgi:hypothetical protein
MSDGNKGSCDRENVAKDALRLFSKFSFSKARVKAQVPRIRMFLVC